MSPFRSHQDFRPQRCLLPELPEATTQTILVLQVPLDQPTRKSLSQILLRIERLQRLFDGPYALTTCC